MPAFDRDVFRSRFLLMRRPDKLAAAEQARLDALFAAHPRLNPAPEALGELHNLYLATDRKGALEALDRFADIYRTGDIPEFSSIVDTFLAWHNQDPRLAPRRAAPQPAESTEPTTCSKSCDAEPTASPTTPTSKPAASS